jgi:hypothetical protein
MEDDDYSRIETIDAAGGGQAQVVSEEAWIGNVAWSPDASQLAFVSDADDTYQLYSVAAGGGTPRRLTGIRRAFTSSGARCTIVGTPRRDVLVGTARPDNICGLGGNDVIRGLGGGDVLDGGAGNDRIDGGAGADLLLGSAGADVLLARDGKREDVDGGPGVDTARVDPSDWLSFVEIRL